MKKIYALFMTLCLVLSATAGPLAGTAKKSYPLYPQEVVKAELSLDASMQKAPAATQALQYDATTGALLRYYNETDQMEVNTDYIADGQVYIDVMAADNSDYLSLLLFVEGLEDGKIPAGTYPIASEPAYGTAYASQGYSATQGVIPCAYYPLVTEGGKLYISTPMYFMVSGSVTIEYVGEDLKVTVEAVNSNNLPINIVYEVGGKSEKVAVKTPLKYDATEGELDVTYGADAAATVTDKGTYGTLQVMAPDASNMLALLFFYPEGVADTETTIPAGTYTISSKQAAGNVLASTGVSSSGNVSYSFYANLSGGQLVTPLYFLLDGTVEVTNVDGYLKVEVNATNSNDVPIHIVYDATPAEEIEWEEIDLEITNLTTEVMEVEGKKYLQLSGRNDMMDADVALFLNDYADVDGDYVVNAESSYMTFGGLELTVIEGTMTQTTDVEKGAIYTGTVRASVTDEEEGGTMYVEFTLSMYAAPATVLVLTDAIVAINEDLGTLTFNVPTDEGGYYAELAGYTAPGVHEGPQICLFMTPDAVAYTNYAETSVADGVITLKGEFTSPTGPKFDVTISGKLPVVEDPEKPEPTYTDNALNPYAFGLESKLSDDGTTLVVTYRLNNSKATSADVVIYNGEEVVATIPGTTTIGKNTVEVATKGLPGGVELTWGVVVKGTSVTEPTQEEKMYSFYHPSSVDVDNNPENPTFGMLLVNEAMQSVASKTEGYVSAGFGAGIFAFTPSFDLMLNGELPGYNGGKTFSTVKNDFAPRRIRFSEDGRIFATAQDGSGEYLWEINPKNLNEWTTVFQGTNDGYALKDADGNFIAGTNSGFDVRGVGENLQLLMLSSSLPGAQVGSFKCHTYDLGTATTWATVPTKEIPGANYMLVTNQSNAQFDKDGGVWYIQYRGTTTETEPGLVHINKDGVEDLKLLRHYTRNAGFRFNDDYSKVVIAGVTSGANERKATVYAVSQDENGAPVLTEEFTINTTVLGSNLNDFAWDYAGNIYCCGNSSEKLVAWALPYSGEVSTPAAKKYAFQLPEPVELVGTVKRAVQLDKAAIVLTHEADGTAHIYKVVDGVAVAELSQEGVVAVDPENAGDLLAISDIALTEDGKLVAINKIVCQAGDAQVDAGYKRGETRVYIWNDLAGAPSVWFTSKMSSNWYRSVQGHTMAYKGTSTNGTLFTTGVTATGTKFRYSVYNVIDGVYTDPAVNDSEYYHYTKGSAQETTNVGANYELNVSALADNTWVLDGELINPFEITDPLTYNTEVTAGDTISEDLGKKYNGASYVTVGEQVLMVAPFATPAGALVGVEILDITGGLDAAQYVDMLYIDESVEATAAATAVEVVEGDEVTALLITLVADATIYTLEAELKNGVEYQVYEDEITNMAFDLDNLIITGGPSTAYQVQVVLALGDSNPLTGEWQVKSESSVSIMGIDATFVEGTVFEVDAFAPSAKAIVRCEWNGQNIELHLSMSAAPMEATVVVVENATIEIEKYQIFGDDYDYSLKMTGVWNNEEDGLDYPVLVEVPVYYPEATEPSEMMSTVTVGDLADEDGPWLGFGEGTLTVTTVDGVVTATGIVQNPMAGVAIDITISGKLAGEDPGTALENATVVVKAVKLIKNGQLIINKGDVEYNAQGAKL